MSTDFNRNVTMLTYTSNEQGSLTLHIRWDAVITIQDTQHSGSIVMDADDFLLVLPPVSFLHKKEVGRVLLRGQFWRKENSAFLEAYGSQD